MSDKYKLYVGGTLIQFSRELSGLSLLKDSSIRLLCPYHTWKIHVDDMILDISQHDPEFIPKDKIVHFFDGNMDNIFKVHNGLGFKKFSVIEYDIGDDLEDYNTFKLRMKNLISELRENSKNFDGIVDDIEISNFILRSKDLTLICAVSEYAPFDFMNTWITAIKTTEFEISNVTKNSFNVSYDSWCLGGPSTSSRTIYREDVDKIFNNI